MISNTIIDKFTDLIIAVSEEPRLKQKLIDVCALPVQQRIVEIEKLNYENPSLPISPVLHLFKNDLIINEVLKYLTADGAQKMQSNVIIDLIKNKPMIVVIPLVIIIIVLLLVMFLKNKNDIVQPTGQITAIVNHKLVLPTNYQKSPLAEYQRIMNENDPRIIVDRIEKFLVDFPNSDYTEDLKILYLSKLFKLKQPEKIAAFLEKNMDYNNKDFFRKIDVMLENEYLDYPKKLITEQLTKNYDTPTKLKLKYYLAMINDIQKNFDLATHSYYETLKEADKSFEYYDNIFLRLSNIYRQQNNNKKLEHILINAANNSADLRYKILALMMRAELLNTRGDVLQTKQICEQIINQPEQQITYNFLGKKFYTSHTFASFLINKLE